MIFQFRVFNVRSRIRNMLWKRIAPFLKPTLHPPWRLSSHITVRNYLAFSVYLSVILGYWLTDQKRPHSVGHTKQEQLSVTSPDPIATPMQGGLSLWQPVVFVAIKSSRRSC